MTNIQKIVPVFTLIIIFVEAINAFCMLTAEIKLKEQPTLFLFIVLSYIAYLFHIPLT